MNFIKNNWIWLLLSVALIGWVAITISDNKKAELSAQVAIQKQAAEKALLDQAAAKAKQSQDAAAKKAAAKADIKKQYKNNIEKMEALDKTWADAVLVSGASARIALAQPMAKLLELKREAESQVFSECLDRANKHRIKHMGLYINAMEIFMLDTSKLAQYRMEPLIVESTKELKTYQSDLKVCDPEY